MSGEEEFLRPLVGLVVQEVLEAEMYVQKSSTRKVNAITEELCGQEFSASSISAINQRVGEELECFMRRRLEEDYPYLSDRAALVLRTAQRRRSPS